MELRKERGTGAIRRSEDLELIPRPGPRSGSPVFLKVYTARCPATLITVVTVDLEAAGSVGGRERWFPLTALRDAGKSRCPFLVQSAAEHPPRRRIRGQGGGSGERRTQRSGHRERAGECSWNGRGAA
jgi:hypothetical protein